MDFPNTLHISETTPADTTLKINEVSVKHESVFKLVPAVKLERFQVEAAESYTNSFEIYSRTRHNLTPKQEINEEPNFLLSSNERDHQSANNDEIKPLNVHKYVIKEEDTLDVKGITADFGRDLDDTKCTISIIGHKTEFTDSNNDDKFGSVYEDHHIVQNISSGRHEHLVTGQDPKIPEKNPKKKHNKYNFQHTLSKFYRVQKKPRAYECSDCNIVVSTLNKVKTHLWEVHKISKLFECDDCLNSFSSYDYLKQHINNVHKGFRNYICNICDKSFTQSGNVKEHVINVHKGIKKFKCNECYQAFYYSSGLKLHIKTVHNRSRNYKCEKCQKYFSCKEYVKAHMNNVHSGIKYWHARIKLNKKIKCENVNKKVKTCDRKIYKCQECSKTYTEKRSLEVHIRSIHTGITKYQCDICQKQFFGKSNLRKHFASRVCNPSKCYQCNDCHEIFIRKHELIKHLIVAHEKTKNSDVFECSECQKIFLSKHKLKDHIRGLHEKNYQCSQCVKYLYGKRNLKRHVDSVHRGIKNYRCRKCHKIYVEKFDLAYHINRVHKMTEIVLP